MQFVYLLHKVSFRYQKFFPLKVDDGWKAINQLLIQFPVLCSAIKTPNTNLIPNLYTTSVEGKQVKLQNVAEKVGHST